MAIVSCRRNGQTTRTGQSKTYDSLIFRTPGGPETSKRVAVDLDGPRSAGKSDRRRRGAGMSAVAACIQQSLDVAQRNLTRNRSGKMFSKRRVSQASNSALCSVDCDRNRRPAARPEGSNQQTSQRTSCVDGETGNVNRSATTVPRYSFVNVMSRIPLR
jgi:hypothetical protein